MSLFDRKVHDYEKGTDYYKSLVKPVHMEFVEHNIGSDEDSDDKLTVHRNELDEGAASFHNHHTTSLIKSKTSLEETKVGEKPVEQSTFEKSRASKEIVMDMDGSKENDDNVFCYDGHHVEIVIEGKMDNVSIAVHLEKVEGCANEFFDNVDSDTEIVHLKVGDTCIPTVLSKVHL
ncbi:hypothetical protein Ddye_002080 [Dipteronia dyeriana]|uniref:Uncharacterized protein n=1 Tax=Dipteronia dyeriana TaxID=168575 RepID=A0AAE0CU40_9ROSI|nr:hypothetical protein Ddye_002080 [Dipteronia dyeriana]